MKGYSEIDVKSPYAIRDSYCPTPKELNAIEINLPLIFERNDDGSSVYERQKLGIYMLTRIIVDCLSSFNISRMMSENQIIMLAGELIDEFPDDPLSVYKMFFTKAKRGYFGDDFNRIDAPTFFKWYRAFRNDIIGYIGNEFRSEPDIPNEDKLKLEENNPIGKEEAEKRFEMLIKKLQINGK